MIDWSALKWTAEELAGISEIRILPRIKDDLIAIQTQWLSGGEIVREDTHIEVLKADAATSEVGEV